MPVMKAMEYDVHESSKAGKEVITTCSSTKNLLYQVSDSSFGKFEITRKLLGLKLYGVRVICASKNSEQSWDMPREELK
ncbi:unnamed protein product [Lactuca virosa]|uniref:Uncharacterized protein n=1 Tax=Lactuca virosa TaxID=75947 RepID=A0AAU9MNM8_9ASTR|nr:unnamed protein product [Lactuca virosa]